MLSADEAAIIILQTALSLETMMAIIMKMYREFGLTVPEATTEVMCVRPKKYGEVRFGVKAVGRYTTDKYMCLVS